MMKQRAEIIGNQMKKVVEDINVLLSYMTIAQQDVERAKEEESAIEHKIEEYRKKEEYYQAAEAKLQEARELQLSLAKEKDILQVERGLIEKEKLVDRERKVQLDVLDTKLRQKQQRLHSIIAD